jgi:cytochrome c556
MAFTARGLERWAKQLPRMFPEGSATERSNAKPAVWTDRAGFEAKAAEYAAAAGALAAAAQAGDAAGFSAGWSTVRETCNACHQVYRAERR